MNKHTPGPWVIDGNLEFTVIENSDTIICQMPYAVTAMQHYANARLIAAAPEMYEALQMFLAYNDQGGPISFDTDAMWAKARSVLAKIEGGGE